MATTLLVPSLAHATPPGSNDSTYGNNPPDAILQGTGGASYDPGGLVALADGSSLVADDSAIGLTKLGPAGLPAPSFGTAGTATVPAKDVDNSSAQAVAVAPGGSYLVAGAVGGNTDLAVAEFNTDGTLDTSFASGSSTPGVFKFNNDPVQGTPAASSAAQDVVIGSDGTIWVVGTEYIGSPSEPALVVDRITSDGAAAELFSMQADGQPTMGDAIALGPNGTVYVTGTENAGSVNAKAVLGSLVFSGFPARLHLDPSFDPSGSTPGALISTLGGASAQLDALAVAPDGDVLIGGQVVSGSDDGVVARVTPSGSFDSTFGSGGVADLESPSSSPLSFVRGLVLEPNGAPVVAGDSEHSNPTSGHQFAPNVSFIAQLTPTGQLDPGFNPGPQPGVMFQTSESDSPTSYDDAQVTGLAMDTQGRLLTASDTFSTGGSVPDEGTVQRWLDYAPPIAAFTAPTAVITGQQATFDASTSSDPVGSISDYTWDFDASNTFATDGGSTPAIQHTFNTPGTVSVSLRVSDAAGWTSTVTHPVTVLAQSHTASLPGPTPRVSLSTTKLSFHANINDFDSVETDTPAQTVQVTNVGTGPLTIAGVQVINSVGGFAISNRCIAMLGSNGAYSSSCTPTQTPADTCSRATLTPGTRCSISVQYQDGGQYPSATGALAIDSNAATSPDLVTLAATATILPNSGETARVGVPGRSKPLDPSCRAAGAT